MEKERSKRKENAAEDRLFNFRPFLFAAAFFALGILFAYLCRYESVSPLWALACLPVAVAPFFFCETRGKAKRILIAELVMALVFGAGVGALYAQLRDHTESGVFDGAYPVVGRVVEKAETEFGDYLVVDKLNIDGSEENGKLVAYLPVSFSENIRLADKVLLRGDLQNITADFSAYRVNDDIRFTMLVETCTVTGSSPNLFLKVKNRVREAVYAGMDETSAAVTMAVLTGDTSGMDGELLENMRRGGIAHIFAVSGLHIGALFAFCTWLAKKNPLRKTDKFVRFAFTAAVLLLYGGVCGYSASVIRAIVMSLVFYAAKLTGIGSDSLERVGLSALVVLCVSPVSLLTVGFQLTFAACLGIVALSRPVSACIDGVAARVYRLCVKTPPTEREKGEQTHPLGVWGRLYRKATGFLSVTVSAQLATAPILLNTFGYMSGWALLLNCIFVPFLSATFSVLLSFVAIASVLPLSVGGAILSLPSVVWSAALLVFQLADFSSFCLEGVVLPASAVLCYYIALSFVTDKWNVSRKMRLALGILFLIGFCVIFVAANYGGNPS